MSARERHIRPASAGDPPRGLPVDDHPSTQTLPPPVLPGDDTAPTKDAAPLRRHVRPKIRAMSEHQPKPPREKHVPQGPVPTMGIWGFLWKYLGTRLYARYGWQWLLYRSQRERYNYALDKLWDLRKVQKVVAIANTKGGSGKTLLATWLSAMYAYALKIPCVAFDVNENPGGTAKRLGVDRDSTIQLRSFIKRRHELQYLSKLLLSADRHRETGVIVIASEKASIEPFSQDDFEDSLRILKDNAPAVFCDFGNNPLQPGNLGSMKMSDVVVMPLNVHMADADDDLVSTMDRYCEVDDGAYTAKVRDAIVVVIGERRLYTWLQTKFRPGKRRDEYAAQNGVPSENLFMIPFNRYMKKGKLVTLKRIPLRIRVVLLEILVAIMQAEHARELEPVVVASGNTGEVLLPEVQYEPASVGFEERTCT